MEGARPATAADLETIVMIASVQRDEIDGQRGADTFLEREAGSDLAQRLEAAVGDDDAFVVVGTYDDVVFGYGLVSIEDLLGGDRLARLEHFVVQREIRKSGIGEAMMNLVEELAVKQGCIGIDSVALPGDRDTKNFFESFGLKARLLTVHRALSNGESDDAAGGEDIAEPT